ncbi:MAG: sugar ABC transporter ATP-binding protein, partial [Thermomicrobiales bacterium]
MPDAQPLLRIQGLTKAFPNVKALTDVGFDLRRGEVLALMGENGAGKSTLLKILSGDYRADAGSLTLDGRALSLSSPRDARAAGIRVIYQEPEIVPGVNVAENLYLGELPTRLFGIADRKTLMRRARADLDRFGFSDLLDPAALGDTLSPAQRQLVEIVRALKSQVSVLALDEPTSSLTEQEADRLFALIDRLRSEGLAIIYVSHRLREITRLADRIVILRDGRLVADSPMSQVTQNDIVTLMVGRPLQDVFNRRRSVGDRVVLAVSNLRTAMHDDVSLTVRAGEVVGLAGLVGAGRTELALAIFGDLPRTGGSVTVDGRTVPPNDPHKAIEAGIALAPEDRKGQALVLIRSVLENETLPIIGQLSVAGFIQRKRERAVAQTYVDRLRIRTPSLDQDVSKLSGGNQQKVVIARWLATAPRVLILDEPTRGIDVGAKAEIYRLIDELASEGMGVLLISSERPEGLGLSDRILVMQAGRIMGERAAAAATESAVME